MPRPLSDSEREILRRLGDGQSTARIAAELGIAESTVSWYVRRLVRDLGPRRTDEVAATLAMRRARVRAAVVAAVLTALALLVVGAIAFARTPLRDGRASPPLPVPTANAGATGQDVPVTSNVPNATLPSTNATNATDAPATPAAAGTPPMLTPLPTVPLATALPLPTTSLPTLAPPTLPIPLPTVSPLPTLHLP